MFTTKRHTTTNHLLALASITAAVIMLLSGCDSSAETVTATVARATSTVAASTAVDTSQQVAPAESATVETSVPAPAAGEATEPPSQTQTPQPTAQATSTTRPTATTTNTPTPAPTRPIPPTSAATPAIPQTADMQQIAQQFPQLATLLNNPAVGMPYKEVMAAYMQGGMPAAMGIARQRGLLSPDGSMILSTLTVSGQDTAVAVAGLKAMGIQVLGVQGNQINIAVSIAQLLGSAQQPGALLAQMLSMPNITSVMPPMH